MSVFKLEKLYFDCIDKGGNCFVIYWANLKFSIINLSYSGLIFSNSQNINIEKSSFRNISKPIINNLLLFNNPTIKIKGDWQRTDTPFSIILYTDKKGRNLLWNCHHPKANTRIVYNNKTYQGWGYSETLTLPIKPWNLPIDELRWGRFLSETISVIWIQWKGKNPLNKLFYNGRCYEDAVFNESSLVFDKGKAVLSFLKTTTIRNGRLSNILAKMPWLKIIFNSRFLNSIENKYKSKSSFTIDSVEIENGWSLFEVVTWGK